MADCFGLENTDELLERLHNRARSCVTDKALIYYDAIDVIEQLLAENSKLKANLDAVPVVLCKDCKSWLEFSWCIGFGKCDYWETATETECYCAYGERRNDEGRNISIY